MPFELALPCEPVAYVFPGQGAHCAQMLEPFREAPSFEEHFGRVCELLGTDPLDPAHSDPKYLHSNGVSSLLTVLASVLGLELVSELHPGLQPVAMGGYSVGQWSALYAAGVLSAGDLFRVVAERARLMDECAGAAPPSGMLAVIGLRRADVEDVCVELESEGEPLSIANFNAPGQYTLAGSMAALTIAEQKLAVLRPKRMLRLPVAGAWHTQLLGAAVARLAVFLNDIPLAPPSVPVVDNTTGDWLPKSGEALRAALARQVASPVLWDQGVTTLAACGAKTALEIGYGNVLSKFGFFIDRSLRHQPTAPPQRN